MKKILLSILSLAALCTPAAAQNAADVAGTYSGNLYLSFMTPVGSDAQPLMQTDVELAAGEAEGTVDFLLNDFQMQGIPVGDIALSGIGLVADGENYRFADNEPVDMSLAGGAIQARVSLNENSSYIKGDSLVASIDIVWVQGPGAETPIYVRINTARQGGQGGDTPDPQPTAGIYQFADPGFENWTTETTPYDVWSSFESAGGKLASMSGMSPAPERVAGYNSTSAVMIRSASIFGIASANGNLTTGTIMMGSAMPADAANYNASGKKLLFAGRPDKVSCDARFISGGSKNGRGRFILHGDVDYRDPDLDANGNYYEGLEENLVGEAAILMPDTKGEWQHFEADFTYRKDQPAEQWMLASFTTNPVPGGSANDTLVVDNVVFTYYSTLSALAYEGAEIAFSENKTTYDVANVKYDPAKLSYTLKGAGATAEPAYNEKTGALTITVKGNDFAVNPANQTVYTLNFSTTSGIGGVQTEGQTAGAVYNLQGVKVSNGSLQGLPAGVYVVNGEKVLVK